MEQRIEVRSLEGHSIVVSISPDRSIGDLKALLKESFLPAKNSPDFHLFFKGAKPSLESRIDAHKMEHGEFMVLVPFAKKKRQFSMLNNHPEHSTDPMESSCQRVMSPAAKSAWYDIMSDLESLSEVLPSDPTPSNCISGDKVVASEGSSGQSLNAKCRRVPKSNHALHDILSSGSMNVFEQETCHRIRAVVESVGCLSNGSTGRCSLFQEFFRAADGVEQCMCPEWLKRVVKMFTFLNIFYAFFHMQHKIVPWDCLEETLKQGSRFGLDDVCVSDVESLSLLCPKVVVMLRKEKNKTNKLASQIIVGDCSTELTDQSESVNKHMTARKPVRTSASVNAVERRETAFKSQLWKVVRFSMENSPSKCSEPAMLTLEDLLSMEDGITVVNGRKAKSVKCTSLASGCHDVNELETTGMVKHLRKGIGMLGQIVHVEEIAAKLPVYVEIPENLSEITKATLKGGGISRLYSHQAESIKVSLSGKNVVVATSTSSGKSLCYNIPVIEALTQNLSSCALYIFPTKALAQDQLRALLEMTRGFDIGLHVGVYDGDTSQEQRIWIRDNVRLLITNPDMLHMSILPYHGRFQRILSNLRYIVIDETHTYKGAFGCHTALILRRLRRICSHVYSSDASFIFCTATSANPREHAMELANLKNLELIQNDGSPCGPKHFILWNPPFCMGSKTLKGRIEHKSVNRDAITRRSSPIMEVSCLFAEMVQHGLRCITFCKTRKLSELVLCYTREILQETAPNLVDSVRVYRAGYIPEDRRKIEADLFGGKLRGVAATNALELGIDVGHIDATLHLGFPGSIASLWQQAGRSGRRARPSLAVYVAFEGPLDQYFMKFPHKLFQGPIEHCQVDAYNQKVLEQHVACAAFELPLCKHYDEEHFGSGLDNAIMALKKKGCIGFDPVGVSSPERWSYIGPEQSPSHAISIRAIETVKYQVVDKSGNEVLEEIEESRAFFQVYEGAVYMHQGITYLVKDLDLSAKIAFCEKADLKYYTKTRDYTDIYVIGGNLAYPPVNASEIEHVKTTAQTNACTVTTKWFGFHRIWKTDNRIFETVELNLPSYSYESQAAWIRVPQSIKSAVEIQEISFRAGQHAASHALLNVVPLYMMCNSSDLSTECANPHETRNIPERILLYEQHPGGIGLSAQIQMLFRELLTAAVELVTTCSCFGDAGCPNCVQSLSCSEYNEVINKRAAIIILKGVIEAENSYFKSRKGSSELNHNS